MSTTQRAVLIRAYGGVTAAEVAQIEMPAAGPGQVLVRVRAAGVNGIDWNIELVLDYVGGEVLDRSWQVLTKTGVIVGTSSPDILARAPAGRRGLWFMNKPDAALLEKLAAEIAAGTLQSKVSEVVGVDDIPAAIERNRTDSRTGKAVADFSR